MAKTAIDGSYVIPVVGWYTNPDTALKHIRQGGHALTLVSARKTKLRSGYGRTLGVHDPAAPNDAQVTTQSAFQVDSYQVTPAVGTYGWIDEAGVEHTFGATADRVQLYGSAYLDGYYAIRAKLFVTAVGPEIYMYWPYPDKPRPDVFRSPTDDPVIDVALHPQATRHPFLVDDSSTVWQFDTVTGEVDAFASVPGARRIVFGKDQTLYALTASGTIVGLDRNGRAVKRGRAAGGLTLDAIAYDEANDRLVGYSRQRNTLVFFDGDLIVRGSTALKPNQVARGTSHVSMSIAPKTGAIHLTRDGLPGVVRVSFRRNGSAVTRQLALPGVQDASGLTVDERGHIFVNSGGYATEFDASGRPVEWSPFAAMRAGSVVQVLRPFSNADPAMATSPSFRNVLPPAAR
jgi:hypothetical protein